MMIDLYILEFDSLEIADGLLQKVSSERKNAIENCINPLLNYSHILLGKGNELLVRLATIVFQTINVIKSCNIVELFVLLRKDAYREVFG